MAIANLSENEGRILEKEPLTFNVVRPTRKAGEEGNEEVLTVYVRVPRGEACGFNAFINLPEAQWDTPIACPQFTGTFFNMPDRRPGHPFRDTHFRIGVSDIIEELGLEDDPTLLVTLVPNPETLPAPIIVKALTLTLDLESVLHCSACSHTQSVSLC